MFEITSTVPIPPSGKRGAQNKYPFHMLKVGDSFFAPGMTAQKLSNASTWHKLKNGWNFKCQTVDGGARCWRIA
jgi:hypothetical protein